MAAHHVQEILRLDAHQGLLQVTDGIVHGNSADHGRAHADELGAEGLGLAVIGKVHDALGAQLDGGAHLLELHFLVHEVAGNAQVHVHLGAQPFAHAFGAQCGVMDVGGNGDAALGNAGADFLGRAVLLGGHGLHLRRDLARTGIVDLGHKTILRHRSLPSLALSISGSMGRGQAPSQPCSAQRGGKAPRMSCPLYSRAQCPRCQLGGRAEKRPKRAERGGMQRRSASGRKRAKEQSAGTAPRATPRAG